MNTQSSNGTVTAAFELVTPELAAEWLEKNMMNRKLRAHNIRRYSEAMTDGDYDGLNGDTIRFDSDGYLADGQHRLESIIVSGRPVETLIVRGVNPQSRNTIDDGSKRTFTDDLTMTGVTNGGLKSALLKKVVVWDLNGGMSRVTDMRFSRKMLSREWVKYAEGITLSVDACNRWVTRWPGNSGSLHMMYWLLRFRYSSDERAVSRFLSIITIGSQEPEDDVLIRCRDKLNSYMYVSPGGIKRYAPAKEELYFLIRAWNAWLGGKGYQFRAPEHGFTDPYPVPVQAVSPPAKGGK